MHENMHENRKIKPKGGIEWSYRPWERKTLQKFWRKTTKKCSESLPSRREKKSWKTFWKRCFWNSQRIILRNLKYNLRLIEKQVRSIEPGKGSHKFLSKISIDRRIDWINRNSGKTVFWEKNQIFWKLTSKHWI